jgi:hypothetical protein
MDKALILRVISQVFVLVIVCAGSAQPTESAKKAETSETTEANNNSGTTEKLKEDKAIALVSKRKDVQAWKKNFNGPTGTSRLGGRVAFSIEGHKGEIYTVHVFEDLPDHTATFNWYEVDLSTGKVTPQF